MIKKVCHMRRRGATLVEAAFVVPIFLLMLLGMMEFGWYARNQLMIANAVREGARAASIGRTISEVEERVINSAKPLVVTRGTGGNITLQHSADSGANYVAFPANDTTKTPAQNGVPAGNLVRISVDTAHNRLVGFPVTPSRLRSQVSMIRER